MRSWRTVNNRRRRVATQSDGNGWDMSANGGLGCGVVTIDLSRPIRFGTQDGVIVYEGTAADLLGVRLG